MPQLDQVTFILQSFLMAFFFLLFYFSFKEQILPKISQSLKLREFLLSELTLKVSNLKLLYKILNSFNYYSNFLIVNFYNNLLVQFAYSIKYSFFKFLRSFENSMFKESHNYYNTKLNFQNRIKSFFLSKI